VVELSSGCAAGGERWSLALIYQTTVTTAATREKLCLSEDVAEDEGVAVGVEDVGVGEPTMGCLAGGGVVELSSGCAAGGAVHVVELLSRRVAVGVVGMDVGVVLDDHYHRSTNGKLISRPNESVCITGGETLDLIPPPRPIGASVELLAILGSTWSTIHLWTS